MILHIVFFNLLALKQLIVTADCMKRECKSFCKAEKQPTTCLMQCRRNCGLSKCEQKIREKLDEWTFLISELKDNNTWQIECRNTQDWLYFR